MSLRALEILRHAQLADIENSKFVRVVDVKQRGNIILFKTHTLLTPEERLLQPSGKRNSVRVHTQRIYAADTGFNGFLSTAKAIKVSCDCERFKYTYEYALYKRGAADIIHSNGEPPVDSNPALIPGCCKHLIKDLILLIKTKKIRQFAKQGDWLWLVALPFLS